MQKSLLSLSLSCLIIGAYTTTSQAIAPARSGQPYAEAKCSTDPNIIFCEDFNYPDNFWFSGTFGPNDAKWVNPGLATQVYGFSQSLASRQINPATNYPAKPQGASPSGGQADFVWAANWDPSKGVTGNGSTWGILRNPGGNYMNGSPPAKDFYIRFQYYVTSNYVWPGDPKTDKYGYSSPNPFDNKIFYFYPPEGIDCPTCASYDAGLFTGAGIYDPIQNARFSDALAVRIGDTSDNYKVFPMCPQCGSTPQHYDYAPYQSLTFRNPSDQPLLGRVFRFNTNRWYTIEVRYKLSSTAGASDGIVEVWIDGTKTYSASDLQTCGHSQDGRYGDCSGLGAIDIVAYHNGADPTTWNGQQVIDNVIISKGYIGPPVGVTTSDPPPAAPQNLRVF